MKTPAREMKLWLGRAWVLAALASGTGADALAATIVIGQSLPLSGSAFPIANRVLAGARTLVDAVNAAGGVQGQKLELVTLDDGGDAKRTADNVRQLVRQAGAVVIVNCLGEAACLGAAAAASEVGVPLVGPISGAPALHAPALRHVFTLRPDYAREARALLGQLKAVGIERALLVGDGSEPASEQALATVLGAGKIELQHLRISASGLDAALRSVAHAAPQALLLSLGPESLDHLGRADAKVLAGLPGFIASLSTPGLTQLTRLLRHHLLGFTSVVPIPEISQLPLTREFEREIDLHSGPEALSFEGFAGYLHLRLCTEAWRRAGPRVDPAGLARAIEALGDTQIGGFAVRFAPGRHDGSGFVEIGMRGRDGRFRR